MPEILYEDNHIIIVNKKCGDIVQGDKTGDRTLADEVKDYIKEKYNKPGSVFLGVTHRIDRPTSGIVVFARTSKALARLNEMFKEKTIKKTYLAVVSQMPENQNGILTHFLQRNEKQNKSYAFDSEKKDSKIAILSYKLIGELKKYFLLEIDLQTGRHHQIRAQLSKIGCTIKGDLKYGAARSNTDGGIHLHAYKIQFIHPVSNLQISINAPLPNESVWQLFQQEFRNKEIK